MKNAIITIVLVLSLAGYTSATLSNPNSVVVDDIAYYMQTDKSVYNLGEDVEMLYRVTNLTENPVDIGMVLKCEYGWTHFSVTDNYDTDIWQHYRSIPPCDWEMFHLDPYESKQLQIAWDMVSDNGTYYHDDDYLVSPGSYTVTGQLELDGGYESVPVSVQIEIIPEPATILLFGLGGLFLRKQH